MDISGTVVPKSSQLNADDLLAGPRTIRITKVTANEGSPDQPVAIHFEGDEGRPYLPCKSMRRLLIAAWQSDASAYIGRDLTLYREPSVKWGGIEVGGIRISHMSHIERELVVALAESKAVRKPFRVRPIEKVPSVALTSRANEAARHLIARFGAVSTPADYFVVADDGKIRHQITWLKSNRPELHAEVMAAVREARVRCDVRQPEPEQAAP